MLRNDNATCCQEIPRDPEHLPLRTVTAIPVRLDTQAVGEWGLLEPHEATLSTQGVLTGKTLVNLQQKEVLVRGLNLFLKEQRIEQGAKLGRCETSTGNVTWCEESKIRHSQTAG